MFPVDIRYVPRQRNDRLEAIVSSTVMRALKEDEGDILVFLPGIGEINRAKQALEKTLPPTVAIHRLAGALPFVEQDAALAPSPSGERRVVLSTDIAETSLTVDGIHIVIDAGYPEFHYGLGHGVGLAIHEAPWIRAHSTELPGPGMITTLEPGVYLPGIGGIRIECLYSINTSGVFRIDKLPTSLESMILH
jgi:hypothetical protein